MGPPISPLFSTATKLFLILETGLDDMDLILLMSEFPEGDLPLEGGDDEECSFFASNIALILLTAPAAEEAISLELFLFCFQTQLFLSVG